MQRRPVDVYDAARGPGDLPHPPLAHADRAACSTFTDGQLDSLQLYYPFDKRQSLTFGSVQLTLDPEQIHPLGNGQGYLEKADVVVLEAMRDQLGKRPIYFSRTVGTYADEFGLTPYLEGQGFARALRLQTLVASDSIVALAGFGWVNLARSKALAFDVYHASSAARLRPRGWVDRPSEGILVTYGLIYQVLGQALQPKDPDSARRAIAVADSITKNSSDFRSALLTPGAIPMRLPSALAALAILCVSGAAAQRQTGVVGAYTAPRTWPQEPRRFDLLHQTMRIRFDAPHRELFGEVTTRVVVTTAPTDTVRLDAENLTIDRASGRREPHAALHRRHHPRHGAAAAARARRATPSCSRSPTTASPSAGSTSCRGAT